MITPQTLDNLAAKIRSDNALRVSVNVLQQFLIVHDVDEQNQPLLKLSVLEMAEEVGVTAVVISRTGPGDVLVNVRRA